MLRRPVRFHPSNNVTERTMPVDEEMATYKRRKCLRTMRRRYWAAEQMRRGELLTEMKAVTGPYRKRADPAGARGDVGAQASAQVAGAIVWS